MAEQVKVSLLQIPWCYSAVGLILSCFTATSCDFYGISHYGGLLCAEYGLGYVLEPGNAPRYAAEAFAIISAFLGGICMLTLSSMFLYPIMRVLKTVKVLIVMFLFCVLFQPLTFLILINGSCHERDCTLRKGAYLSIAAVVMYLMAACYLCHVYYIVMKLLARGDAKNNNNNHDPEQPQTLTTTTATATATEEPDNAQTNRPQQTETITKETFQNEDGTTTTITKTTTTTVVKTS